MENLNNKIRSRFSAFGQGGVPVFNNNGGKIEPFKGEDKMESNWFWRHFSGPASRDYDSSEGDEFAPVLAAAAFAVTSLEEAETQNKMMREGRETSLTNSKSRRENGAAKLQDTSAISRWFSSKEVKDMRSPDLLEISEEQEQKTPRVVTNQKLQEEASKITVSTTKEMHRECLELENRDNIRTSPLSLPSAEATVSNTDDRARKWNSSSFRSKESRADLWKQKEMTRIREWYEKTNSSILSWEEKKKARAKRHLERRESGLDKKRAKSLEHFRMDIVTVDKIAGKERTKADERKQKEESKANEEEKHIRLTGKVHASCFGF